MSEITSVALSSTASYIKHDLKDVPLPVYLSDQINNTSSDNVEPTLYRFL